MRKSQKTAAAVLSLILCGAVAFPVMNSVPAGAVELPIIFLDNGELSSSTTDVLLKIEYYNGAGETTHIQNPNTTMGSLRKTAYNTLVSKYNYVQETDIKLYDGNGNDLIPDEAALSKTVEDCGLGVYDVVTAKVKAGSLTNASIERNTNTGSISVIYAGMELTEGTDYSLHYLKQTSETELTPILDAPAMAGTYVVYAEGKGGFTGETQRTSFSLDTIDVTGFGGDGSDINSIALTPDGYTVHRTSFQPDFTYFPTSKERPLVITGTSKNEDGSNDHPYNYLNIYNNSVDDKDIYIKLKDTDISASANGNRVIVFSNDGGSNKGGIDLYVDYEGTNTLNGCNYGVFHFENDPNTPVNIFIRKAKDAPADSSFTFANKALVSYQNNEPSKNNRYYMKFDDDNYTGADFVNGYQEIDEQGRIYLSDAKVHFDAHGHDTGEVQVRDNYGKTLAEGTDYTVTRTLSEDKSKYIVSVTTPENSSYVFKSGTVKKEYDVSRITLPADKADSFTVTSDEYKDAGVDIIREGNIYYHTAGTSVRITCGEPFTANTENCKYDKTQKYNYYGNGNSDISVEMMPCYKLELPDGMKAEYQDYGEAVDPENVVPIRSIKLYSSDRYFYIDTGDQIISKLHTGTSYTYYYLDLKVEKNMKVYKGSLSVGDTFKPGDEISLRGFEYVKYAAGDTHMVANNKSLYSGSVMASNEGTYYIRFSDNKYFTVCNVTDAPGTIYVASGCGTESDPYVFAEHPKYVYSGIPGGSEPKVKISDLGAGDSFRVTNGDVDIDVKTYNDNGSLRMESSKPFWVEKDGTWYEAARTNDVFVSYLSSEQTQITNIMSYDPTLCVGNYLTVESGRIGLQFVYRTNSMAKDDITVTFRDSSGKVLSTVSGNDIGSYTLNDTEYYSANCYVAAKDMTKAITAEYSVDGIVESTVTKSVRDIAGSYLNSGSDKLENLTKSMLLYGTYAQRYFNITGEEPLDPADLASDDVVMNKFGSTNAESLSGFKYNGSEVLNNGITFSGATLTLGADTSLSLYFETKEDIDITVPEGLRVEKATSGKYRIARIRGFKPDALNQMYTFTVNSTEISYSPMTYCYNVLTKDTTGDDLKNVCKALHVFGTFADEYTGKTVE
ncbi:MAG: hypothetical protein J6M90_05690 [Oscillospiraceae bacterium]|nr:hypothetical protein [Oscillospiraceae bacterium]